MADRRRRSAVVRSRNATLSLSRPNREFVEDEARRRGLTVSRLLGNLVETVIDERLFTVILGDTRA